MKNFVMVTICGLMLGSNSYAAEHVWRHLFGNLNNNLAPSRAPGVWILDSTSNQPIRHTKWNVNDWTNSGIPLHASFQASVNPDWYGSSSVQ